VLRFFCGNAARLKEISPRAVHKLAMARRFDPNYLAAWDATLVPQDRYELDVPSVVPQVGQRATPTECDEAPSKSAKVSETPRADSPRHEPAQEPPETTQEEKLPTRPEPGLSSSALTSPPVKARKPAGQEAKAPKITTPERMKEAYRVALADLPEVPSCQDIRALLERLYTFKGRKDGNAKQKLIWAFNDLVRDTIRKFCQEVNVPVRPRKNDVFSVLFYTDTEWLFISHAGEWHIEPVPVPEPPPEPSPEEIALLNKVRVATQAALETAKRTNPLTCEALYEAFNPVVMRVAIDLDASNALGQELFSLLRPYATGEQPRRGRDGVAMFWDENAILNYHPICTVDGEDTGRSWLEIESR
jgi:hypothetical protein